MRKTFSVVQKSCPVMGHIAQNTTKSYPQHKVVVHNGKIVPRTAKDVPCCTMDTHQKQQICSEK
jgi:hypothetical protein